MLPVQPVVPTVWFRFWHFIRIGPWQKVFKVWPGESLKLPVSLWKPLLVLWYSDNQNVESILLNGSKKSDVLELALQAFHICLEYHISLDVKWDPEGPNETADSISKFIDFDDYALSDVTFQEINSFWGPHTVDRFACNWSTCPSFSDYLSKEKPAISFRFQTALFWHCPSSFGYPSSWDSLSLKSKKVRITKFTGETKLHVLNVLVASVLSNCLKDIYPHSIFLQIPGI